MNNLVPNKIRLIYIFGFILATLLSLYAFRWQVVEASRLSEAIALRKREYLIPSVRGAILAKDGSTLAYSEPRFDAYLYLPEIQYAEVNKLQTRDELLEKVLPYLEEYDKDSLIQLLKDRQREGIWWFMVAEGLTLEQKNEILDLRREDGGRLEGISLQYSQKRFYPEGTLASHVLGLADSREDGGMVGRGGLEGGWNGNLEPQKGYVSYDIDAAGNPVAGSTGVTVQAKRGSTIVTSIDKFLQSRVEQGLEKGVEQFRARSGTALVMDPKTGEILALANYPTYDPNTREVEDQSQFGNAAVSQPYEIGSVGKTFTLAAAIDSGEYNPKDIVIEGHEGCEDLIEGFRVCNLFEKSSGPLTLERATVLSDNVAYYHLSKNLGPETMYEYLSRFGVGYASGVDISGESFGYIKPPSQWNENDISAYSYGTSYQMNAIQAISAVGAIANYGVRMQPRLVNEIREADGNVIKMEPQPVEKVMSDDASRTVSKIMNEVYKSNIIEWNYKVSIANDPIAMKSGTGLIVRDGVYSRDYNATYVGFDTSEDRRFIMLIRLDSPQEGRISSENARLVWLDTYLLIRDYLGIGD